jgi:TRAP-type mannitol/chloroaromatic compound transport system permease small subunit
MATAQDAMLRVPPLAANSIKYIDGLSIWTGKTISWLVLPMLFALMYEVIMRYLFRAPTIWAMDVAVIAYGIHFMIASPYCLQQEQHIRCDFLYNMWSVRKRAIVDMVNYIIFFFPVNFLFLWIGWGYAERSFMIMERSIFSPWMPWIWPVKMAIPLMVALSIIQGVSEFIKCYYRWKLNANLWAAETIVPHPNDDEQGA